MLAPCNTLTSPLRLLLSSPVDDRNRESSILFFLLLLAVRTPHAESALHMRSMHSTRGVSCPVSVSRGVCGYLKIVAVVIAKFRSYDKNRGGGVKVARATHRI